MLLLPSLALNLFPHSDSDSDSLLNYIGIANKWVQYPLVSDVAIAMWKQSYTFTYNPLKKHRYHSVGTGHNLGPIRKEHRI